MERVGIVEQIGIVKMLISPKTIKQQTSPDILDSYLIMSQLYCRNFIMWSITIMAKVYDQQCLYTVSYFKIYHIIFTVLLTF